VYGNDSSQTGAISPQVIQAERVINQIFCAARFRGEVWTTVHSIQVIENERRIEMRVERSIGKVSKWPTLSRIVAVPQYDR
jgi:hypothetical protein